MQKVYNVYNNVFSRQFILIRASQSLLTLTENDIPRFYGSIHQNQCPQYWKMFGDLLQVAIGRCSCHYNNEYITIIGNNTVGTRLIISR